MPLYNEEQKNFIVTKMGYNPSEFDYDEISNTVVKRPAKLSPSTSEVVDDGKVELPEVQQELFSPLQTGVGTFAESALPAVAGGYTAGAVAKAVSPLMGKGIAGTLSGIGLIALSGLLSGRIAKAAQDAAANAVIPETMDTLQQSQIENSTSATLGGLASVPLGGMNANLPNVGRAIGTIPKLAMGMAPKAEEVANLSNVAGGAAIGTGIDWLNAKSQNAEFNPVESLLINTIFNKPNILGRKYGFTDPADLPPSEPTREMLTRNVEQPAAETDKIQGVEVFNPETRPYLSNEEFWNDLAKLRNASKNEPLSYSLEPQKIEKPEFVSSITKRGYTKEEVKQGSKEFEDRMKEIRSKIPFLNKETKYQDVPTDKPVYTKQQQELLDKVKVDDDPINTTEFWDNFWNELSARRNVRVTEDGTIVNAQTGKPVAGQASKRVGNEPVDVRINPEMAGADTRPHELTHPSFTDLKKSPRRGDNIIYEKSVKIVEQSPEYADWKARREAQKLDGSVEEFIATNGGIEAVSRALQNSSSNTTKQNIKNWWRDVSAYYKLRFTKHATIDEMQRVINYKMLHDPDFASVFKKSAITTQNVSKTIENNKVLNTPEFKLVGSQMWKGREIPESMVTPEMNNFTIENYGDFFKRHPIGSKVKASNPDGGGSFYGTVKGHTRNGNLQVELPDGSIRYSSEKQIFGEGLKDKSAATVAPKNVEEISANTSVKNQEETALQNTEIDDENSAWDRLKNTEIYRKREALFNKRSKLFETDLNDPARNEIASIEAELKNISDEFFKQKEFIDWKSHRDKSNEIKNQKDLDEQRKDFSKFSFNENKNNKTWNERLKDFSKVPVHGTDLLDLKAILSSGYVKAGSALDLTPDKEWVSEYGVGLVLPTAKKGSKIEHNNFYKSFNNAPIERVIINADAYIDEYLAKVIPKLKEEFPNVKFEILNETKTKNQEQSLLPSLEDKKIRAASAFAKMREATDNPEIVKQAEKEDIANTIAETNTKIDKKAGIDRSSEMYSTESPFAQKEKEKRGPFYLETAKYLDDNFKNNADKEIDANQLISTIRNKFPSEYETLNETVNFRDAFPAGSKVSAKELAKWINENGPRIEVKKLEANFDKKIQSEAQKKYLSFRHNWFDNLSRAEKRELGLTDFDGNGIIGIEKELALKNLFKDRFDDAFKYLKLRYEAEVDSAINTNENDSATRKYTRVNPKPLENMPGAVDLLVRIPVKDRAKYKSSHYPQSGENLLAHVRGYMETLPDGKKVFHVFELQSDWAQEARDNPNTKNDPLLKHYERLAVKAAINHAKENGADYIAISDAETAMMTEQHDQMTRIVKSMTIEEFKERFSGETVGRLKKYFGDDYLDGKYIRINPDNEDLVLRMDKPEVNGYDENLAIELQSYVDKGGTYIPQEKGMRFHYDNSLPRIAEDLTGSKGESVSFGEHQNKGSDVFKNAADGSPKTDITARMYPISGENVKDTFTLTKKKYSTESILKQTETPEFKKWFEGSKVVDPETGKPLVVYHGSSENNGFSVFDKSKVTNREEGRKRGYVDWLGHVNYFTPSKREASAFALNEKSGDNAAVYPVYLNIKNPFDTRQEWKSKETKNFLKEAINFFNKNSDEYLNQRIDFIYGNQSLKEIYRFLADKFGGADKANEFLIKKGYDGIIDKSHDIGLQYATFYPEQIKSAIGNTGAFDPKNPDIRYSTESILKQTETPEFKKWFGDSKIVDEETGKPLVVYHGSNSDINVFDKNKTENGKFGKATYFVDDPKVAEKYGKAVYPTFIKLENPLKLTFDFTSKEKFLQQVEELDKKLQPFHKKTNQADLDLAFEEMWKDQKSGKYIYEEGENNTSSRSIYHMLETRYGRNWPELLGHDGLIVDVNPDSALGANREYVVYNSENIKSAIGNTGKFDPKNPDIRYSTSSALFEFRKPEIEKIRTLKHKDADKVADAFTDFYRSYDKYKGKFAAIGTDKLIDKLSYTDPKERFFQDNQKYRDTVQYLDDMMDYGKSSIIPDPEVLQIIKDVNAETLKSKAASMDLGDLEGHEYYLAQVPSRKALDTLLNKPESPEARKLINDWFTYYKDVLGKTRDEALDALRIFKAGYRKQNSDLASQYGPIDKAAGVGIPSSWREKNLIDRLGRFVNRYSRRLAHIDSIESNKVVQDALNDPEKGLAGADVVRNVMFDIEGQRDIAEANREVISGLVRSAWMGTLTGVKDFTSNLFLGMQHQTLDQAMLSPFKAWSNMKQNLKESFEAGVNRKNIGALEMLGDDATISEVFQYLRRGRDILSTVSGRNYLEKVTRATAFGQGKWLAQDNIWRAHKNRLNSQSEKFLNDFVPDWKSYVKSGILPADVLERAAIDYVGSVQGTYDPRGLPIIAQRGSLAPYLSLSRWSIEKLNNFEKHVVKPAMQGNYKPLLNQTIGLMIGGAAVNAIVEQLTGKKEKTPKLKELKEIAASGNDPILPLTYKLAAYASLSGYAGMYGDVAKMIMDKTYKNRIQTMNNPIIEGTYMLGKNTADYLQALKDEGVTPENVGKFIEQNLEDYFQIYRLMAANTSEDKKKEIEKSNEFRDLKLYRNTHGEETSDVTTDRANPFKDQDIKKFREEEDITKILPEAEKLIAKAFENADGDIFKLRKELRKIKFNSNRTMPSIDESPDSFQKYLLYLEKTQGRDEAVRRMTKYFKDRALNKAKSDLVPDV